MGVGLSDAGAAGAADDNAASAGAGRRGAGGCGSVQGARSVSGIALGDSVGRSHGAGHGGGILSSDKGSSQNNEKVGELHLDGSGSSGGYVWVVWFVYGLVSCVKVGSVRCDVIRTRCQVFQMKNRNLGACG